MWIDIKDKFPENGQHIIAKTIFGPIIPIIYDIGSAGDGIWMQCLCQCNNLYINHISHYIPIPDDQVDRKIGIVVHVVDGEPHQELKQLLDKYSPLLERLSES